VEGAIPELFFCDDLQGYAWCFRKGSFLNIGSGREGETRLSALVETFYQWLSNRGRIPSGMTPRFHGHAYRLYVGPPRKLKENRVVLIGDAAGLAYAQSGEGIRPAVESGMLAAATILETPRERRDELAAQLQRKLLERFGPRGISGGRSSRFPAAWRRFAARQLLGSRWFSRHVLIERWFLHVNQPPLEFASRRRLSSEIAS
jgi:menaquinone-9 beta-reductase